MRWNVVLIFLLISLARIIKSKYFSIKITLGKLFFKPIYLFLSLFLSPFLFVSLLNLSYLKFTNFRFSCAFSVLQINRESAIWSTCRNTTICFRLRESAKTKTTCATWSRSTSIFTTTSSESNLSSTWRVSWRLPKMSFSKNGPKACFQAGRLVHPIKSHIL